MSDKDWTTPAARAELRRLHDAATRGERTNGPLTNPRFVGKHAIDHIIGHAAVPARVDLDRTDAQGRTHHDRAAECNGGAGADGLAAYLAGAATAVPCLLDAIDARDAELAQARLAAARAASVSCDRSREVAALTEERDAFARDAETTEAAASANLHQAFRQYDADLVAARTARDAALALLREQTVCTCGCPMDDHEDLGEAGVVCDDEAHECLPTFPAIGAMLAALRAERDVARERSEDDCAQLLVGLRVATGMDPIQCQEEPPPPCESTRDRIVAFVAGLRAQAAASAARAALLADWLRAEMWAYDCEDCAPNPPRCPGGTPTPCEKHRLIEAALALTPTDALRAVIASERNAMAERLRARLCSACRPVIDTERESD